MTTSNDPTQEGSRPEWRRRLDNKAAADFLTYNYHLDRRLLGVTPDLSRWPYCDFKPAAVTKLFDTLAQEQKNGVSIEHPNKPTRRRRAKARAVVEDLIHRGTEDPLPFQPDDLTEWVY